MLTKISLQAFRNIANVELILPQTLVIFGENGSGKTSILEALYLLSGGESFRAVKVDDMISIGSALGRVEAKLIEPDEEISLEILLTRGQVQGRRVAKRVFSVNGIRRTRATFSQNLDAVIFRPEDLRLIEGSPARRRQFLDETLNQIDKTYTSSLNTYNQTLVRRNKLLPLVRAGERSDSILTYWNQALIKHGQILQIQRQKLVEYISGVAFPREYQVLYLPSVISQARQIEYLPKEIAAGHTLIGPHKDDFELAFSRSAAELLASNSHSDLGNLGSAVFSLARFGSRGQQRLAVLWLKLAQLAFITHQRQSLLKKPLLLLDDVMSELDEHGQQMVLKLIGEYQTIITTADERVLAWLKNNVNKNSGFRQTNIVSGQLSKVKNLSV